ncbi:MAG TPA: Obg family GTPase CgtA, partial [Mycobacteriales bacterium]
ATAEPGRDPLTDLDVLEAELQAHGGLDDRPRLVALNKIDVPEARDLAAMVRPDLEARGLDVYELSAASHEGLRELTFAMGAVVSAGRTAAAPTEPARITLRPRGDDDAEFVITRVDGSWRVRGAKPQRWVKQTDFSNDEAVGYLADRLHRIGVEDELRRLGAEPGAEVTIGDWTFDWEPVEEAYAATRRGEDERFAPGSSRARADERLAAKKARRLPTAEDDGE